MKIDILRLAMDDIKEIGKYLSDFGEKSPKIFKESFEKFCGQVSDTPFMFNQYEHNPVYRKAVIAFDYLVLYRIDENNKVKIYRVLHDKRNMEPLIK